jgi:broad specificity phosphatase PhoE
VHGHLRKDEVVLRTMDEWGQGILKGGGEFEALKERTGRALTYLEERPESHILVVTHGFFMRALLARVIFGDSFTPEELGHITHAIPTTEKTHITVFHYHEDGRKDPWKLWVWNDHAHLG